MFVLEFGAGCPRSGAAPRPCAGAMGSDGSLPHGDGALASPYLKYERMQTATMREARETE